MIVKAIDMIHNTSGSGTQVAIPAQLDSQSQHTFHGLLRPEDGCGLDVIILINPGCTLNQVECRGATLGWSMRSVE